MVCPIAIKAPNGKDSILFKSLATIAGNSDELLNMYYYTRTIPFKQAFGDWEEGAVDEKLLDSNGEPKFDALSNGKYLNDVEYNKIELDNKAQVYKNIINTLGEVKKVVREQIKKLQFSDKHKVTLERLEELAQSLEEGSIDISIPKFLGLAEKHIGGLFKGMTKLMGKSEVNMQEFSSRYKVSKMYDVIYDIKNTIYGDPEITSLFKEVFGDMEGALQQLSEIEFMYLNKSFEYTVEKLAASNPNWNKNDIRKWLKNSPKDIKWYEKLMGYIGDSGDRILASVGKEVANVENEKRREAIEFNKDLSDILEKLELENKGKNAEAVFADLLYTAEDNTTHILDIGEEFTNGKDREADARYNKVRQIEQTNPTLYEFLKFFNSTYSMLQGRLANTYGAKLGTRIPTVLKSTYERIHSSSASDIYKNTVDEMQKSLSRSNLDTDKGTKLDVNGKPLQQIPLFFTQKYDSRDYNKIYEKEKNTLISQGYSVEKAEEVADEFASKEAAKVTSQFLSKDLVFVLQSFHAMATNYAEKNAILPFLESVRTNLARPRSYNLLDSSGKVIKDKEGFAATMSGEGSQALKMFDQFMDMQIYGVKSIDLGITNLFGYKIDNDKFLRRLGSSTSMIQLALNLTSGINNFSVGSYNNMVESIAGEYVTMQSAVEAGKIYYSNLGSMLGDVGQRVPKSLLGLLEQRYNILQEFTPRGEINTGDNKASRLLTSDLAFIFSNIGEHQMQMKLGLSILINTKAYDKTGAVIGNVFDMHSVKDGELVIKDFYVKDSSNNLVPYDTDQEDIITNKSNALLRKVHGNYNETTATAMQQDGRLALVLKFRKWAYEGALRRFSVNKYNTLLEQDVEGFYRTGARVGVKLIKDLSKLKFDVAKEDWQNLTPHEKANMRRIITETSAITLAFIAAMLLGAGAKYMEDKYDKDNFKDKFVLGSYELLLYETNRAYTELFAYINPKETLRLFQTPAASTSLLVNSIDLLIQVFTDPLEEYETGWKKGKNKALWRAGQLSPGYKQIVTFNPEGIKAKSVFFNLN